MLNNYKQVLVKDVETAEKVVEQLMNVLEKNGVAFVSDLNDLIGQKSTYADKVLGWKKIEGVATREYKKGWMIYFPLPDSILDRLPPVDYNPEQIVITSKEKAAQVLEDLQYYVARYGRTAISEFKKLTSQYKTLNYVDAKWGWRNLSDVKIREVDGGYVIDLPSPEPI